MRWSERPPDVRSHFSSLQPVRSGRCALPMAVAHLVLVRCSRPASRFSSRSAASRLCSLSYRHSSKRLSAHGSSRESMLLAALSYVLTTAARRCSRSWVSGRFSRRVRGVSMDAISCESRNLRSARPSRAIRRRKSREAECAFTRSRATSLRWETAFL